MRKIALLLAMVMLVSVFAACGTTTSSSTPAGDSSSSTPAVSGDDLANTLVYNLGADPKTIDPGLNSAVDGSHIINNTFEGLYRDRGNGAPEPAMAESVDISEDETVYTFHLRDAKWSDGKPVTAADFVFAWRRAVDPATASEYGYILAPIKNATAINNGEMAAEELGAVAVDEKTLEVTLENPTGYFLDLTGFATLMPLREDVVGSDVEGTWAKDPAKTVSNGPFVVSEYVMNDRLVLTKNPEYWNAENVKLEKIIAKMIAEESTALTAFRTGELDLIDHVPAEEIPQMVASGECEIYPRIGTSFYVLNTQTPALSDIRVRKALNLAVDRTALTEQITRAGETPAMGFVPYGFPDADGKDFRETAGNYYLSATADVEQAKALLAEAGYPDGEGLPELEILYNTTEVNKSIAEALQSMWEQIGVKAKLTNQEWAVFQNTRLNLQYNGISCHGWSGDYLDPQTFLDMFISGNVQSGNGYANPEYDAQMEIGMAASGKTRFDAFYAAEKILMEDAYVVPLYFNVTPMMCNENFTGWYFSPTEKFWFGDAEITR
ncbi:MAG: peptide ABC transporter substrate-binding protein [Oscillospiraceae bacterium]|nr:peptide ABC transporter substrate-binding protein [Oscillospiraceae bacterium]